MYSKIDLNNDEICMISGGEGAVSGDVKINADLGPVSTACNVSVHLTWQQAFEVAGIYGAGQGAVRYMPSAPLKSAGSYLYNNGRMVLAAGAALMCVAAGIALTKIGAI